MSMLPRRGRVGRSRRCASALTVTGLASLVVTLAGSAPAVAQTSPCPAGTPSAVRIVGLPERIPFGVDHVFSTDFGHLDWDLVGRVHHTMADARSGDVFFEGAGGELEDLYVRLDLGDGPVRVSARYVQRSEREVYDPAIEDYTTVSTTCEQTVSRTVAGFRRFYLANCDQLRYRPRRLIIACGDGNFQLRGMRWRSWNGARARGSATALLNDCIPYCAEGRFHRMRARIVASRPRICRRGNGAEGYHYTRLRISYRRPLSRTYFPWASPRNRRGYTYKSTCFSYDY